MKRFVFYIIYEYKQKLFKTIPFQINNYEF